MSADKNFLARWARRKLEVARGAKPRPSARPEQSTAALPGEIAPPAETDRQVFDAASLPSLESITAGSDIRAFLAPGVPAALTRAALRRAWSSDPAIRDFVGLAENSWDFTAPDGVPGFGPITAEEVQSLLRQAESDPGPREGFREPRVAVADAQGVACPSGDLTNVGDEGEAAQREAPADQVATAAEHQPDKGEALEPLRRGHGGALPR